ncbi:MAG: metallo-mystery pair system four-Cys motif protein [Gammaproteobacteria bacterium]
MNTHQRTIVYSIPGLLLVLALLSACSPRQYEHSLTFQLQYNDQEIHCDTPIKTNSAQWSLQRWQLYLYGVEIHHNQQWRSAQLIPTQTPQVTSDDRIALLSVICKQSADPQTQTTFNVRLLSSVAPDAVDAIRFTVGVPFDRNHQNPLTQTAPLNRPDMFWVWQTGHKFLRLELTNQSTPFIFHLGSTGCASASALRPAVEKCKNPNRIAVQLDNIKHPSILVFDLATILEKLDNKTTTRDETNDTHNCLATPDAPLCQDILSTLGVNASQTAFYARPLTRRVTLNQSTQP